MQTMKLRAMQHPGHAVQLLDSYIRREGRLPRDSQRLTQGSQLTPSLEKLAERSTEDGNVWRAWSDDRAIWLWTCEVSLDRSRERGMPVMEVSRYDEFGGIEESGTWVCLGNDNWQRCEA